MAQVTIDVISETDESPISVVESFFAACKAVDIHRALDLLADDIEYQNVPLPPDRGKPAVERTLRRFIKLAPEFDVRMHNIAAQGHVVLTERTDILRGPFVDLEFWVCGTFEIRDGKIVLWRDRFDLASVMTQLVLSPVRRLLRRKLRSPS